MADPDGARAPQVERAIQTHVTIHEISLDYVT